MYRSEVTEYLNNGMPCQSLSSAVMPGGKNQHLTSVHFEFVNILDEEENVKNNLSDHSK